MRLRAVTDRAGNSYPVRGLAPASHLFALVGFAVAQPLFDLLARQAEFFIAHAARPIDPVMTAVALSVVLPLALVLLVLSAALLGATAGRWVHRALVAGLSGLVGLLTLKWLVPSMGSGPSIFAAAGMAVVCGILYDRFSACRTFLTILSPAGLLFPLLFLFASPVRQLVLPATVAGFDGRSAGGQPADAAPVVMVVFDELPLSSLLDESGIVDPVRYPNLAALARDAHWFRDATTASTDTVVSVPIILSGRLPERPGLLPQASDHPDNLFTWLGAAGYRMNVVETQARLCPQPLCSTGAPSSGLWQRLDQIATDLVVVYLHRVLPVALTVRLPAIEDRWSHFTTATIGTRLARMAGVAPDAEAGPAAGSRRRDDVPRVFADFLENVVTGEGPALHFIHLLVPHGPWRYLPSGREYGRQLFFPHSLPGQAWKENDEWQVIQGFQRHLLQVGYADRLIGQLVAKLEQENLYHSAMIVVVADHGATFRASTSKRWVSKGRFADVLNVPLLVKLPGQQQPVWRDGSVRTVDVLPTLADALDLGLPWPTDGESALKSTSPERPGDVTYRGMSWDVAALRASRARGVAEKLRLFGSGQKPGGLFRIGRRADLVGRVVDAETGAVGQPAVTVELTEPWSFEALDPSAPIFPSRVSGRVRLARPRSGFMELAVAVNRRIEAVTRTFGHGGDRARFTAMVPERALRAGHNRVEIFEIAGDGSGVLVATRQPSAAGFTLVEDQGKEALRAPGGRLVPWVQGSAGKAKVRTDGRRAWIEGRFATGKGLPPAETLLVFAGDRCIVARDGELSRQQAGRSKARFLIRLPAAPVAGSGRIRLFAVAAGAVSEIAIS